MCGIVGYNGNQQAAPILLKGLEKFIAICAPLTFGMFILETQTNLGGILFMTMYQLLGVKINRILISWIAIILKFIIFSIIVYLLRLIPLVRRYI